MTSPQATLARRALDRRLSTLRDDKADIAARPAGGWIRGVREALGMSTTQLARRLGISRQGVLSLERSERNEGIRLASLRKAADALDCHLVYALVPNSSLQDSVERQAMRVARSELARVNQTMLLEAQRVDDDEAAHQLQERATALIGSKQLWNVSK